MEANLEKNELVELTAEIVSAYVSNNTVVATDLPGVIHNVFDALSKASSASGVPAREELKPVIPVKKSVTPEYIICLEDGKKFKSLKRHLRTHYAPRALISRSAWDLGSGGDKG
jgi:predicted transcriptional regulator